MKNEMTNDTFDLASEEISRLARLPDAALVRWASLYGAASPAGDGRLTDEERSRLIRCIRRFNCLIDVDGDLIWGDRNKI